MKLLAIDTSSQACSLALLLDNEVKTIHEIAPMQQAQKILPMIQDLLQQNKTQLNQLDAIAYGCGPGSFTGIRIGVSVAQGLGFALNIPLISISSLAALAQTAYEELGWKNLLVGIDARIQEIYWGQYQANTQGWVELIGKEIVCAPEEVVFPKNPDWYGVGNAWEVYRNQLLFTPLAIDETKMPTAKGILALAKIKYKNQEWVRAEEAVPVYLRDKVTK